MAKVSAITYDMLTRIHHTFGSPLPGAVFYTSNESQLQGTASPTAPTYSRRRFLRRGTVIATVGLAGCNDEAKNDGGTNAPTSNEGNLTTSPQTITPSDKLTPTLNSTGPTPTPSPTAMGSPSWTATPSPTPTASSTPTTNVAKFTAEDGDSNDALGAAVALDGTTAIIGAPADEDPNGDTSGSAYVFERSTGRWRQQAKLVATDGDADDSFGTSVGVADDTALVGAPGDEDPTGSGSPSARAGSAYVFQRENGTCRQQAKLVATDRDSEDAFAASVAIVGNNALIGAPFDEDPNGRFDPGRGAGSAYVFERSNDTWGQVDKLADDDGTSGDAFGGTVAYDGDSVLIGAPGNEEPNGQHAGSAYIFERSSSGWNQQAKFAPTGGDAGDLFGAVALDGPTALVGAPGDEHPNGDSSGSAYVFERSAGGWSQQAKLAASDGDARDGFGTAVSWVGHIALIGAPLDDDHNGSTGGSAYLYERSNGRWTQEAKFTAWDGDSGDLFGESLELDSSTALIGASHDEDPNGNAAGSAYTFEGPR